MQQCAGEHGVLAVIRQVAVQVDAPARTAADCEAEAADSAVAPGPRPMTSIATRGRATRTSGSARLLRHQPADPGQPGPLLTFGGRGWGASPSATGLVGLPPGRGVVLAVGIGGRWGLVCR